jgi:hypothetical protein
MSLASWIHLIVILQVPGFIVGFLGARDIYRRRAPRRSPADTRGAEPR